MGAGTGSDAAAGAAIIVDWQGGADYLANLQLASPEVAQRQLRAFLDALLQAPPDPATLFALLEQAALPLAFVQAEVARRYHNHALPLGAVEEECFHQVTGLWHKVAKAYALCAGLTEPAPDNPAYVARVAGILHRCLYYTGMVILAHYRARRELPPGVWLDLHGYYASAEEWGIASIPVGEVPEAGIQSTHCTAAYVAQLLIEVASPYSHSVRNMDLIFRWAAQWAPLVAIRRLDDEFHLPPYLVELMKDVPLHASSPSDDPTPDARCLDTARLGLQIGHALSQLRQGLTPSELGLGEETPGRVIGLLEHLSRPWGQSATPRRYRRFETRGTAKVAVGFAAIHHCLTGKKFEQPDIPRNHSRGEFDTLFTFRDRLETDRVLSGPPAESLPLDEWAVINQSAKGFRLAGASRERRLAHHQLMVVRPPDGDYFLLAKASWLMQEASGELVIGVATLPGIAKGIAARVAAPLGETIAGYEPAFLLSALPQIADEASLVVSRGSYKAGRLLDCVVENDAPRRVRMQRILQRGFDFEQVSYEML